MGFIPIHCVNCLLYLVGGESLLVPL
jgi:hypothetical protein